LVFTPSLKRGIEVAMSTVYDDPCPEPTEAEHDTFAEFLLPPFLDAVHRRFGHERAEVILDNWHVCEAVAAIMSERGKRRRILSDLNEELRFEQYIGHMEWTGDERGFRPMLLLPTREP
jgi:hypothetical protein